MVMNETFAFGELLQLVLIYHSNGLFLHANSLSPDLYI